MFSSDYVHIFYHALMVKLFVTSLVLMVSVSALIIIDIHSYMNDPIMSTSTSTSMNTSMNSAISPSSRNETVAIDDSRIDQQGVELTVKAGASFSMVAAQLQQLGVIDRPAYFKAWAIAKKHTQNIKPGEYVFISTQSPRQVLYDLVSGKVKQYQITIVEGKRFKDFLSDLQQHPKIIKTITDLDQVYQQFNIKHASLEGLFFPDTYTFDAHTTDMQILQQSHQLLMSHLHRAWQNREINHHLSTPYEALVLASIVEKETSVAEERARIAGVFLTRLDKDMRLQTDPTVIYGLGEDFDGNLTRDHLRQANPYNTYVNKGLPPSPIALVSKASIMAVMQPQYTGELYFVSKKDGTHHFSKTYQEHVQAVRKYQLN